MTAQLQRVADFERDKEQRAAQAFLQAQQFVNQQKQKLANLQHYRLEYLRSIQKNGKQGVQAKDYHQHLSFVGKLDSACQQQQQIISQALLAADERKRQWLAQQQRLKAVTMLIDKRHLELVKRENKQEQAMLDEFAAQRFYRLRHSSNT